MPLLKLSTERRRNRLSNPHPAPLSASGRDRLPRTSPSDGLVQPELVAPKLLAAEGVETEDVHSVLEHLLRVCRNDPGAVDAGARKESPPIRRAKRPSPRRCASAPGGPARQITTVPRRYRRERVPQDLGPPAANLCSFHYRRRRRTPRPANCSLQPAAAEDRKIRPYPPSSSSRPPGRPLSHAIGRL